MKFSMSSLVIPTVLYNCIYYSLLIFLISCGVGIFNNANGQEVFWQKTLGGNSEDYLYCLNATSDGGYIYAGSSYSGISGEKSENGLGGFDYWIVKTDGQGVIIWQNTIGGTGDDYLYKVVEADDNGFLLGGVSNSDSSFDKSENCRGGNDYWIVKIDSIGNILWQRTIGGSGNDNFTSLDKTNDGGFILGGYSSSNISGEKTEPNSNFDYWIVKTDAVGNIQWQNTIGGQSNDILNSVRQTKDGGFILGGSSNSNVSGDKTENSIGSLLGSDFWVVKTDSNGIIQWQNTIGGFYFDGLMSIDQTIDGGYILGGMSNSTISADKSEKCIGGFDYWIVKVNSQGIVQWQNTIGGKDDDLIVSVLSTSDGGYLAGGMSLSGINGDKKEHCLGGKDYWVVKLNSYGVEEWQNTIGSSVNDLFYTMTQASDGSIVLGGYSESGISGDKNEVSRGLNDFWVVKLTDLNNQIIGTVYIDLNKNGARDAGDPGKEYQKVKELSTGQFAFANHDGHFNVTVVDTGSFNVTTNGLTYYTLNPLFHTASFTSIHQIDSLNNFAIEPNGQIDDVCVSITPIGPFRSGRSAGYQIQYYNYGTTNVSPVISFYPDTNVIFQSADISPTFISSDSVIWNLSQLLPFESGSIIISLYVDLGVPIGTLINSRAHIEPYLTDVNPSCNNSNWEVYTTGSFDPNDIIVNRSDFTTTELSASPWLEYIIRFQNTGNDTAFTVKILNPIDTNKLDISSIEFVNASHPVNINWINYQRNMEFKFDNILLPDSNTNEPLSHGFVRYRIQPKTTLNAGDTIPNFAAIYFDFNEPVITNTATTIIVLPTGLANSLPTPGKLLVFPNPAENSISISGIQLENGKAQLRLMDIYGKLILEKTISETSANLETDQLAKGVYLIQCGGSRATFVKQ